MTMASWDKNIITALAIGDRNALDGAIEAYRRNIPIIGIRGNIYQEYMAEVDHPAPNLRRREEFRRLVVSASQQTTSPTKLRGFWPNMILRLQKVALRKDGPGCG